MMKLLSSNKEKKTTDWKELLAPQDEERINEILKKVAKYRGAYRNADEVKNAQLWCSILELNKSQSILNQRLLQIEEMFSSIYEKMKLNDDEKKKLYKSLETF